jgi:CheY-like chemotaxis protein
MTANVFREDIERCLAVGMNAHVSKPLDIQQVIAALRKYLAGNPLALSTRESSHAGDT